MEPRLPKGARDLTERQREVARLVADGLTNAEIGERLGISLDGAKYHVSELLTRLNLERREQVGEWVQEQSRGKRRYALALVGMAAVLVTAVVVVALVATNGEGDELPASGSPVPTSSDEAGGSVEPTAAGSPSSTDLDAAESLYQPVAWDHPTRVNRTPPSSLDEAIKERVVHADGWQFEGTPPAVFDLDAFDGEVCPALPGGVGRAQSGDWVLDSSSVDVDGDALPTGQRMFTLYPVAPDFLDEVGVVESTVRIRAVDAENWQATHLTEALWTLDELADGAAYRFVYESPRDTRWMAVVTAGPLWGCFTLELENDPVRWSTPNSVTWHWYPEPPADEEGDELVLREYSTIDGEPNGGGQRECVNLAFRSAPARSGQFVMSTAGGFGNSIDEAYSPFVRASRVAWLPQYKQDLGVFRMRATLATQFEVGASIGSPAQPVYTYSYLTEAPIPPLASDAQFITAPVLPRGGMWSMLATAGPYNFGCFLMWA